MNERGPKNDPNLNFVSQTMNGTDEVSIFLHTHYYRSSTLSATVTVRNECLK